MAYRNKTFVSFDSADIHFYRLMQAWNEHDHIDFNFYDAHDLNTARDTSLDETIKRRLGERMDNTKQVVMLIGDGTRTKAADSRSFLHYEVKAIIQRNLPVVFAHLNGSRDAQPDRIPTALLGMYTVSVSFQAKIIKLALDGYVHHFSENLKERDFSKRRNGPHTYLAEQYKSIGL